jgi:hypothetical protein
MAGVSASVDVSTWYYLVAFQGKDGVVGYDQAYTQPVT